MSYLTLEVEIDHGKVVAKVPSKLPEKASGLLTIIPPDQHNSAGMSPLEAWQALQERLRLSADKAAEWMARVQGARH